MLSEAELDHSVSPTYVKNKLYKQHQNMDANVYAYAADVINMLRNFSVKKNGTPSVFNAVILRKIRNTLVSKF